MAESVYYMTQSTEPNRPDVAFVQGVKKLDKRALNNLALIRGEAWADVSSWVTWNLACKRRGSSPIREWDYFSVGDTTGVISERACNILSEFWADRFLPMPALLDNKPWFFLHLKRAVDCLNSDLSEIEYFEGTKDVMMVRRHKFFKERIQDPMIFSTPEECCVLFATETIPIVVKNAGLRGFDFPLLDG